MRAVMQNTRILKSKQPVDSGQPGGQFSYLSPALLPSKTKTVDTAPTDEASTKVYAPIQEEKRVVWRDSKQQLSRVNQDTVPTDPKTPNTTSAVTETATTPADPKIEERPESWEKQWADKIQILIDNIVNKNNHRLTSGTGSDKVATLKLIKDLLDSDISRVNSELQTTDVKGDILGMIKAVCQERRHSYHWFQQPHSAREFSELFAEDIKQNQPIAMKLGDVKEMLKVNNNPTLS